MLQHNSEEVKGLNLVKHLIGILDRVHKRSRELKCCETGGRTMKMKTIVSFVQQDLDMRGIASK